MITIAWGLLFLVLLVGLLVFAGSRLPREHTATSRLRLSAPPERVWAVIRALDRQHTWWPALRSVAPVGSPTGAECWRQSGRRFGLTIRVAESDPPARLRTVIEPDPGMPFGGDWVYQLRPDGTGTELTLTENGWIGPGFFRLVSRVTGYHRTIDDCLAALARHLDEPARPEHL